MTGQTLSKAEIEVLVLRQAGTEGPHSDDLVFLKLLLFYVNRIFVFGK